MGKPWRNAQTGPDLIDVEIYMRHIEQAYDCQVQLVVTPAGISATGGVSVTLVALVHALGDQLPFSLAAKTKRWPCGQHNDFWSCMYEGLYMLDADLERTEIRGRAK